MNGQSPRLTAGLLRSALTVPLRTEAPPQLHESIAAAIWTTPQEPAPLRMRPATSFAALPLAVRLALAVMLLAALLVGLAVVGGQLLPRPGPLGDSSTFRGDVARTGVVPGPGPEGAPVLAWEEQLGGQVLTSPAVVDGVLYVGATDGLFRALDLLTGAELWRQEVNLAWSSPTVAGDVVLFGTDDRQLLVLDRFSGQVMRRIDLGAFASGSPAVVEDLIYVATSSELSRGLAGPDDRGEILAIDLDSGSLVWSAPLPGPSSRSVAVDDSIVVVPTEVGIAVAFDVSTGQELWRFATGARAADTPVIADGRVFIAGLDLEGVRGGLWAVDIRSGRELWRYRRVDGQTVVAPAVDADVGVVYAGSVAGDVTAHAAEDGRVLWTQPVGAEVATPPTKAGDVLYVATNGEVVTLDAPTGDILGRFPIDAIPFSPAVAGAFLVVGTQSGHIYALSGDEAAAISSASLSPVASASSGATPLPVTPPPTSPLTEVWARSAAVLELDALFFISIAPDGRLWVADSPRGRFIILNADGTVVDTWQPTGDAALDLVQPDNDQWGAVAFLPDGGFVIADTDHQRVLRFDARRQLIDSWGRFGSGPGQFVSPFGVAVGPDGLIYVVDDSSCRVQVFEDDGAYVRTLAGGASLADRCTNNVVVDGDGTVYLPSGGHGARWKITAFAPDGSIIRHIGDGLLREPVLVAAGPDGELYATDGTDTLRLFTRDGDVIESWSGRGVELAVIGPDREVYATGSDGVIRRYALLPAQSPSPEER